jgi:hypothetical protein
LNSEVEEASQAEARSKKAKKKEPTAQLTEADLLKNYKYLPF